MVILTLLIAFVGVMAAAFFGFSVLVIQCRWLAVALEERSKTDTEHPER
jgi:hypothetical protein